MIAECVQERRRTQGMRVVVEVWHIAAGPVEADADDASWRPIKCGGGICFPAHAHMREPTCEDCIAAAASRETQQTQREEATGDPS